MNNGPRSGSKSLGRQFLSGRKQQKQTPLPTKTGRGGGATETLITTYTNKYYVHRLALPTNTFATYPGVVPGRVKYSAAVALEHTFSALMQQGPYYQPERWRLRKIPHSCTLRSCPQWAGWCPTPLSWVGCHPKSSCCLRP